jgi:predicted membrane-bound mannosyltransferase
MTPIIAHHLQAIHYPRFLAIVRAMKLEHWGYVVVMLLGGELRFWDLGFKPLHHDENMHAY